MTAVAICPAPQAEPQEAGSLSEEGQQKRHKIVIHAAVAALFGDRAVVRDVRETPRPAVSRWTLEGRRELYRCHETDAPLGCFVPGGAWEKR